MQAAVLERFGGPLVIEDVDVAEAGPDEVLIRTAACGVCHSDRTIQLGAQPRPLPFLLGHEAAGVVEQVGAGVRGIRPGDHVVACGSAFCGSCEWCMRGLLQHCESKGWARADGEPPRLTLHGQSLPALVGLGAFASHLLVHERAVAVIPPEMPLDRAALLGCAVLTGMGAVRHRAQVAAGQTVAVIGCGGVGLNAIQGARMCGAARIVAVDLAAAKLTRAQTFGATDVVDASDGDPVRAVRELTGGGVDHALEVVGSAATIQQAFAMTRTYGTTTVIGVTRPEETISVPAYELMQEKRLQGSRLGSSAFRLDIPLYSRLYLDGRLMLDELVSDTIALPDVNAALTALDGSDAARSVIVFA
jgi:S-(hydroxymethyl)glutathione dehydrogenase / alcohol dehydrogenase